MPARTGGGCLAVALTSLLIVTSSTAGAEPIAPCPAAADAAVICEINAERRVRARPPLVAEALLALAARRHSRDMVRRRYFSHGDLSGRTLVDRLRAVGSLERTTGSWAVGEVLAWGTGELGTPAGVVAAWMRSRSHRRVLLGRDYREVGVGVSSGTPFGASGTTYAAALGSG